jgi:hypothetical protein
VFQILTQKHNLQTKNENEILVRYGGTIGGKFYGYTTYNVDSKTGDMLLKIIPKVYRKDFEPSLISINIENVIPHTDTEIKATINFYVDTADGVTSFHKVKDGIAPYIEKLPNQTDGALYQEKDLDKIGSFKANYGDIYVLDVKQIHSVKCKPNAIRTAYCLKSYTYNYEDVLNILRGTYEKDCTK